MPYYYQPIYSSCEIAGCNSNNGKAVGFIMMRLTDHSLGGTKQFIPIQVCAEHTALGEPVERKWREEPKNEPD